MNPGTVYFVGAGPGDPELITLKGRRLLEAADYVLFTGSLVPETHLAGLRAEAEDSKGLTLEGILERLLARARAGERVVRLHTGDPAIFGAIHEQIAHLEAAGVAWEVVPGVTSALAAAAALGAELTIPDLTQTVVLSRVGGRTPMPPGEELAALAALGGATLCLYLSATLADKVQRELIEAGRPAETPVAIVQHASLPTERRLRTTLGELGAAMREARVRDQAMILVGPALNPDLRAVPGAHLSRLYAADFSHRYRRGEHPRGGAPPEEIP